MNRKKEKTKSTRLRGNFPTSKIVVYGAKTNSFDDRLLKRRLRIEPNIPKWIPLAHSLLPAPPTTKEMKERARRRLEEREKRIYRWEVLSMPRPGKYGAIRAERPSPGVSTSKLRVIPRKPSSPTMYTIPNGPKTNQT